ncbi:hypothetical protein TNCV_4941161 [Trichonephila clavipes]|nr:hypothetical protein TNCV_4941161 [Trichonephila clavipes]
MLHTYFQSISSEHLISNWKIHISFDGEVAALQVALAQLHCHLNSFTRAVFFCDSKAAIFAVNSNSPPTSSGILDCKKLLQSLSDPPVIRNPWSTDRYRDEKVLEHFSEQIVVQWIPGHCGVTGNEFADHLAKKRASIQQITRKAVPFTSARRIIKKKLNDLSQDNTLREIPIRSGEIILKIFPCGQDVKQLQNFV